MSIEIRDWEKLTITAVVLFGLVFATVGYWVTPWAYGEARVLTPDRWHSLRLERRVASEAGELYVDASTLKSLVEKGRPSPVDAMLLAERIYAHHRKGTAATAAARERLIVAAETGVRYASGMASREEAVGRADEAFDMAASLMAQRIYNEALRRRMKTRIRLPLIEVERP